MINLFYLLLPIITGKILININVNDIQFSDFEKNNSISSLVNEKIHKLNLVLIENIGIRTVRLFRINNYVYSKIYI
jgi:hypothetical protein